MAHRTLLLLCFALLTASCGQPVAVPASYKDSAGAASTHFAAPMQPAQTLTIEAATDVTFMRPFILAFQRRHPNVAIDYEDSLSTQLLANAQRTCKTGQNPPDLYISVATDHLVKLANDGCAQGDSAAQVPPWREWRHEVFAFALEPAVFVYNRKLLPASDAPRSHIALIEALRSKPRAWHRRIATYDITQSGIGYNYAEFDARESATFGRLIESLGRSDVRLYCCSNEMVEAVRRGDVLLAYNVQLSYALAAQRTDRSIGIAVPTDFQAIQTRSALIPKVARRPDLARAFVEFLLSSEGHRIASSLLSPAARSSSARFIPNERLLSQANVSSSMLRLQDTARRETLLREWADALRPGTSRRLAATSETR